MPQRPRTARSDGRLTYAAMLSPAIVLLSIFVFVPVALVLYGSLFRFGLTSAEWTFVGLSNYVRAMGDGVFWIALRNNIIIVVGSIVLQVGFGTLLAAVLDRGITVGNTVLRTIIFAPMVISSVAVGLIWLIILDPNVGPLVSLVKAMGLTPPRLGFLGDPSISIWVVLGIASWQYTGFMMVLILAGLQAVPKELYQAAALDGATGLRAFWHITLPAIRNILIVAVLITTVGGFKVFDLIFVTTGGGPANATQVLSTWIYFQAFNLGNTGYADAISVILLAIAVLLGWAQLKSSRRA
ncbi:carbohydrate ABC transporter permease [Oceaniglobus trochenteri]|uniref:carbohydrate ABC transporter permease n=1 Tax=Oceaniglobus trochenteri TaxID=2763260 RepID=UPI001CFFB232|nr:sugar ABC transporter permease [Oceaniglobus trochenteri]